MNIIEHGLWLSYTPGLRPAGAPSHAMFARREFDGADWYVYRRTNFQTNSVKFMALAREGVGYIVGTASRDVTMIFPPNHLVFEITDYVGDDPQGELKNKIYDPVGRTFTAQPLPPAVPMLQDLVARIEALEAKVKHLTG